MTSALKPEPPSTHPSVSALGTPATKHEQLPILEPGAVVNETPQQLGAWNKRLRLMGAILLPVFVETLDYTVVATAQPHIASAFDRLDLQNWIGIVYVLTSTVFLPLWGYISDIFGRHNAIQFGIVLFIIGSAICTGANSMPLLLVGRGIAGIGAAGLTSVSRIILFDSRDLGESAWQSGMLSLLYAVGYSVGPVIGGVLASADWRYIFVINLPIGVLSSALIFFLIRKIVKPAQPPHPRPHLPTKSTPDDHSSFVSKLLRIDWYGAALFIAGGILVLLALHWGSTEGWGKAQVIACFVAGGLLLVVFGGWEYIMEQFEEGHKTPPSSMTYTDAMIPLSVFKSYDVCTDFFIAVTNGAVMFGIFYQLAIYFAISKGYSATRSGVQLLWFTPGIGVGVAVSTIFIKRRKDPCLPITLGTAITTIALGLLSSALRDDDSKKINGYLLMVGIGLGLSLNGTAIHIRFAVAAQRVAIVISLFIFFQTAGGTIGLAQLAAVLNSKVRSYITGQVHAGMVQSSSLASLGDSLSGLSSIQGIESLDPALVKVVADAFRDGVRWAFISLIPWAGGSFLLSLKLSAIPSEEDAVSVNDVARETVNDAERIHVQEGAHRSTRRWRMFPILGRLIRRNN